MLAARVEADPLGLTVGERDVEGVVAGIERLLDDAAFAATCRERMAGIAGEPAWDRLVAPIASFCASNDSYAMPADRRRPQSYTRGAAYPALKKLCRAAD